MVILQFFLKTQEATFAIKQGIHRLLYNRVEKNIIIISARGVDKYANDHKYISQTLNLRYMSRYL